MSHALPLGAYARENRRFKTYEACLVLESALMIVTCLSSGFCSSSVQKQINSKYNKNGINCVLGLIQGELILLTRNSVYDEIKTNPDIDYV